MLLAISCISILSSCIQRQAIKQGRIITREEVSELQIGMSPLEVEYVLGSPSIINPIDQNRWEYVYISRSNKGKVDISKGYLIFEENKLTKIELSSYFE